MRARYNELRAYPLGRLAEHTAPTKINARCSNMAPNPPSPAEMNRRHSEFWAVKMREFERRLADAQLVALATEDMASETLRGIPTYYRKIMERAYEDAEKRQTGIRRGDGSQGGRPRKGDALQELIEEIVRVRPTITVPALLERLHASQHEGVIEDIDDGRIWFVDARGASRNAPISGLKDRLTRARKSVNSRKPVFAMR